MGQQEKIEERMMQGNRVEKDSGRHNGDWE